MPPSLKDFSKMRGFLWPIHKYEMKKFLPTAFMMFFVIFNYHIMRNTKDTLLVPIVGPEAIPFVKILILPLSILLVLLYTRLANFLSQEKVFYCGIFTFVVGFGVFYFVFLPYRHFFLPDPETVVRLQTTYPFLHHILSLYQTWIYVFFYFLAELWGGIALQFLFWQFANEITRVEESKRFYPMYAFIGHCSLIVAGYIGIVSANLQKIFGHIDGEDCDVILDVVVWAFMGGALVIVFLRRWITHHVLQNPFYYDAAASAAREKDQEVKLSLFESIRHVLSSPYIGLIMILILGYGVSNNILGLLFKKQLQIAFPLRSDYQYFMGKFTLFTGILTIILTFLFKGIIPKFGWYVAAMVTPVVLFVTGGIFFGFILFDVFLSPITAFIGLTPLVLAVGVSAFQQIISKSAKYSIFDPTKEMAYIPLDPYLKTRGKAAADVVGNSLSKASGGYIVSAILVVTMATDLLDVAWLLALIVMTIIWVWIKAVFLLNKRYTELLTKK